MVTAAAISALVLLALLVMVTRRGLRYVARHPELLTQVTASPRTYLLCLETFREIVARYHTLKGQPLDRVILAWQAPNGLYYLLTSDGVEERRSADDYRGAYRLRWEQIGGVGLRMQPDHWAVESGRAGDADSGLYAGYGFRLLVVPASGRTIEIGIATDERADAVEFAAHMVAVAEQKGKKVNALGFDRPPILRRRGGRRR